jgi:hypothetical protein
MRREKITSKKGCGHDSSGRIPSKQARGPEFKSHYLPFSPPKLIFLASSCVSHQYFKSYTPGFNSTLGISLFLSARMLNSLFLLSITHKENKKWEL